VWSSAKRESIDPARAAQGLGGALQVAWQLSRLSSSGASFTALVRLYRHHLSLRPGTRVGWWGRLPGAGSSFNLPLALLVGNCFWRVPESRDEGAQH